MSNNRKRKFEDKKKKERLNSVLQNYDFSKEDSREESSSKVLLVKKRRFQIKVKAVTIVQ